LCFYCATGYFTLWFAINALYNIANKQTLQKLPLPWLISSVQLVVGSIYIGLVWALKMRPAPELNKEEFKVRTATQHLSQLSKLLHLHRQAQRITARCGSQ
jgi:Triose-phosphate Transporter family